jgi:hypothetical protein
MTKPSHFQYKYAKWGWARCALKHAFIINQLWRIGHGLNLWNILFTDVILQRNFNNKIIIKL